MIVEIDVHDAKAFEEYRKLVAPTIQKYGGKYLVRGGKTEVLEGGWNPKRIVVLEFDSVDKAKQWYDSEDYRPAKAIRLAATSSDTILVEGV